MRRPRLARGLRSLGQRLAPRLRQIPWRRLVRLALGTLVLGGVLAGAAWHQFHGLLIDEALFARPLDAVRIEDREGRSLRHHLPDGVDAAWVSSEDVPEHLVRAFLAAEDQRFEEHSGVDAIAVLRAVLGNLTGARLSGASTITQQVIKLVYGRPHGLWDKPLEIARALELESRMTKDEILEQYLNRVPMGNGIVGVARAAEAYFGHPISELTLAEAALLAGIPQSPSRTEPRRHATRARARRDYVIERMRALGWVSDAEADAARATPVVTSRRLSRAYEAPRFVDRVIRGRHEAGTVRTSLDLPLQHDAEALLDGALDRFGARGAENGAALVLDAHTGEMLVYVGAARDDADDPGGALDLLRARRQPGSTLKPFAYELFFEDGHGPATLVDDVRTPMRLGDGTSFVAHDFDGGERGAVRARVALSGSLNLAAIDVVRRVGPARFVERLARVGFGRAASADHESAAVVLGGIDVTALELASAYALLARGGRSIERTLRPRAEHWEGEPVLSEVAVALVRDVLEDGEARREAFGAALEDEARGPFALKTGTSAGFFDAWSVAFDDDAVVVVWIGSPARRAMDRVSGFEAAAPVAARLLGAVRAHRPPGADTARSVLAAVHVCPHSGLLVSPDCPHGVVERFDPARLPTSTCPLHPGGREVLPERYAAYVARHAELDVRALAPARPRLVTPRDGASFVISADAPFVPLAADGATGFLVDGVPIDGDLYRASGGEHTVVAVGASGNSERARFTVRFAERSGGAGRVSPAR